MTREAPIIQDDPPNRDPGWRCRRARCGSGMVYMDCASCDGSGFNGHDCGEDTCCCLRPDDNVECSDCDGRGWFRDCDASFEWCGDHPMPGRDAVESAAVEWFRLEVLS